MRIINYESCEAYLRAKGYLIDGSTRVYPKERRIVSMADVKAAVCAHFGVSEVALIGDQRYREIVRPRQVGMYLSKAHTHKTLPQIGRAFGGRDHTTVIHGCRQIEKLRETDAELDSDIRKIEGVLT